MTYQPKVRPDFENISFETAAAQSRRVGESLVDAALRGTLEVGGDKVFFLKNYLDTVPITDGDREFASSPEQIADFHDDAADFISSHYLCMSNGFNGDALRKLQTIKNDYLDKLQTDKVVFRDYVHQFAKVGTQVHLPRSAYSFVGMGLRLSGDRKMSLLTESLPNLRGNIFVQIEVMGQFVHWRSKDYVEAKMHGINPNVSRRIYLNPKVQDTVGIMDSIVRRIETEDNMLVCGKFWDRTTDGISLINPMGRYSGGLRGDGIVLYAAEKDAAKLLQISKDVYKENPASFQGRSTSRIPFPIGEGIALGDEPTVSGASLTSHRSQVIDEALVKTGQSLKGATFVSEAQRRQIAHSVFLAIWENVAEKNNITPRNVAFNKSK